MAQMDGAVSYCFWEICSKNTGLQGSTLSGPRMTTGFGPFELPTLLSICCSFRTILLHSIRPDSVRHMHTLLSLENFQHESDHVITITNNKRVILEFMTSTKLLQHRLDRTVGQAWSVRVGCPMDVPWMSIGQVDWTGQWDKPGQ